jgi:hypothetical protein
MPTPAEFVAILLLAVGIFFAGYMANRQPISVASSASAPEAIYNCPMHPQYTSEKYIREMAAHDVSGEPGTK